MPGYWAGRGGLEPREGKDPNLTFPRAHLRTRFRYLPSVTRVLSGRAVQEGSSREGKIRKSKDGPDLHRVVSSDVLQRCWPSGSERVSTCSAGPGPQGRRR